MDVKVKREKIFNIIGVVAGIILIILGIYFLDTPAEYYITNTPNAVEFGADFYTYEHEATVAAAKNAAVTANNLREFSGKVTVYYGTTIIILGAPVTYVFVRKIALA